MDHGASYRRDRPSVNYVSVFDLDDLTLEWLRATLGFARMDFFAVDHAFIGCLQSSA
jgi:hypothetical protein